MNGPLVGTAATFTKVLNTWNGANDRPMSRPLTTTVAPLRADEVLTPLRDIDYILVYEKLIDFEHGIAPGSIINGISSVSVISSVTGKPIQDHHAKYKRYRQLFEQAMLQEGLHFESETVSNFVFVKVHCPFDRLCAEAEAVKLDLPLLGLNIEDDGVTTEEEGEPQQWLQEKVAKMFDMGVHASLSAPFQTRCKEWFMGYRDRDSFYRSSIRGLLTHYILSNIDISKMGEHGSAKFHVKRGLPYLLLKGVYVDAFILHDRSVLERLHIPLSTSRNSTNNQSQIAQPMKVVPDVRKILHRRWRRMMSGQPLDMIRDYFGEKISFYFAWVGTFVGSLVVPALIGLGVFFFGVIDKVSEDNEGYVNGTSNKLNFTYSDINAFIYVVDVIKAAGDTFLTPVFAFTVCLWGTVFLEVWKRKQASLAHRWNVDHFSSEEPDRPQFYGTVAERDPITNEIIWVYPFYARFLKYLCSFGFLVLMSFVVLISVLSVTLYQVYMFNTYCDNRLECEVMHGSLVAPTLNTISIMVLGKIYSYVAEKLTDWENHRTRSMYNDALIIKLFAFQFTNTYASLFYTAFFREGDDTGLFGLGNNFRDKCGQPSRGDTCMSLLSLQLLILMIVKPVPKFLYDVVWPRIKSLVRSRGYMIRVAEFDTSSSQHYLLREMYKQDDPEFRRDEFSEKIIQYGYLVLFAASFPLAPLLALLYNVMDLRLDSNRLLWVNRRPVAFRDDDIGMWFHLFNFINVCGVVTNAFIIAFTSTFGRNLKNDYSRFVFVVAFEERQLLSHMMGRVAQLQQERRFDDNTSLNHKTQTQNNFRARAASMSGNNITYNNERNNALNRNLSPIIDDQDHDISEFQ